ncbi:MAG TPA: ISNCY family transposase [Solirubrobacterales bacterium]|nr:ISNCY family transposase [Solirubrobacterales bacterium]
MLRERALGETLWESILPPEARELPLELRKVDEILDEDRFLAPFRKRLTATTGRPTVPIDTYLRLMFLKHRYGLGYETLCKEVADSLTWRRFCRIALDARVPDPTTLLKLTRRLGPELVEELNAEPLRAAVERKVLRSRRLRVDTTHVEADIRSPTDSGLCAHAVSRLTRLARRLQATGAAARTRLRDRRRSVGVRVRKISAQRARGRSPLAAIDRLTAEIAARARRTVREAREIAARAKRSRRPHAKALAAQLERELAAAEQVLAQTDLRLAGQRTIPDRRISLVDPDARPIRQGNPRRPTEFGFKARVADTGEGFVIADVPGKGNPSDDALLSGAIAKAKDAGMRIDCVLADRGFGTKKGDAALDEHKIKDAVIPRRGRASPREATRAWRRRYRFRNGLEGRISQLKRGGLRRTRLRGVDGARTWVSGIALAHNLRRMAVLT